MIKIKTPSADYAHLTEDREITVCGRKVYTYWIETEVEDIQICERCTKEMEQDEKSNEVEPVRTTKPKGSKLASW